MEKLKKISLGLILMLCICFSNKAYATVGCNARVTAQRQEVTIEEEVNVTLSISNIQGEKGILVIGGVLEYDKNYLTLIGRSAGDMWSLSYNSTTGQFVADRDGFTKNNESVSYQNDNTKEENIKDVSCQNGAFPSCQNDKQKDNSLKDNIKEKVNISCNEIQKDNFTKEGVRIPKIEREIITINYKPKKSLVDTLTS